MSDGQSYMVMAEEEPEGEITEDDLTVESYADLRKKLLEQETVGGEGVVEEQIAEEEQQSLLEAFADGVKKWWKDISNWFAGLGK